MDGKWLIGNGHWCPACGGTGQHPSRTTPSPASPLGPSRPIPACCQSCGGEGRLPGEGPMLPRPPTANWRIARRQLRRAAETGIGRSDQPHLPFTE